MAMVSAKKRLTKPMARPPSPEPWKANAEAPSSARMLSRSVHEMTSSACWRSTCSQSAETAAPMQDVVSSARKMVSPCEDDPSRCTVK